MSAPINKRFAAAAASRARILAFINGGNGVTRREISVACGVTESMCYAALTEFFNAGAAQHIQKTRTDRAGMEYLWYSSSAVLPVQIKRKPAPAVRHWMVAALFGAGPARAAVDYDVLRGQACEF